MLTAEVSTMVLVMPPMAWARRRWDMTSEITAMDVGAIAPAPSPASARSAIIVSMFGAKAEPRREATTREHTGKGQGASPY